jgi:putative tryptophan/tyrosine transport system substrate-binding protein
MFDMRRREFITLLGAAAWPLAARAQNGKPPVRLGFVPLGSPSNAYDRSLVEAFQQGLSRVGLIENRDIILDVAWASGNPDQAVSDVVRRGAELLIPCGSSAAVAAKRQTSTIPIVFLSVGDPIAMGLVASLRSPGQNATGFSDILADLSGKLVDLSKEFSKPGTTVEYLWHTAWPDGENRDQATEQAVQEAGMKLRSNGIVDIGELDDALMTIKRNGATTLIVQPSPFTYGQRGRITLGIEVPLSLCSPLRNEASDDLGQYPVEVLNRAADIFRMAGHMLGKRLLFFPLHRGLVVDVVDDGRQIFPRRRD